MIIRNYFWESLWNNYGMIISPRKNTGTMGYQWDIEWRYHGDIIGITIYPATKLHTIAISGAAAPSTTNSCDSIAIVMSTPD
jgi:uncharacterized protein YuzE